MVKNEMMIPNKAYTHAGSFHADDVFSAALLKMLNPNIEIERVFRLPEDFDGLAFDIGMGEFDHHQADNEIRDNGIPYAAFGKLWRAFGDRLVSERGQKAIDETLIQALDDSDNTGHYNPLAIAIAGFNPTWDSDINPNDAFNKAVDMASQVLTHSIEYEKSKDLAKDIIDKALESAVNKEIVIFPRFVPAVESLIPTDAKFFVFPSNRGGYNIQVVPKEHGNQAAKIDLPKEWAGQREGLNEISNIDDLTFCHVAKFLASTNTLDGAIKAAVTALNGASKYETSFDEQVNQIRQSIESQNKDNQIQDDITN